MSLSSLVDRSGEELARVIDRRKFLRRLAVGIFSLATGTVIALDQTGTARAAGYCPYSDISAYCGCTPENGRYCNDLNPSYCNGYHCAGGCTHDTNWHGTGCWCTKECTSGCYTVYYVCCDCHCNGQGCTCGHGYQVTPVPKC